MGLFEVQVEPEVVDWLVSLTPAHLARVDEVCGLLAEEGTHTDQIFSIIETPEERS